MRSNAAQRTPTGATIGVHHSGEANVCQLASDTAPSPNKDEDLVPGKVGTVVAKTGRGGITLNMSMNFQAASEVELELETTTPSQPEESP